MRMPGAEWIGPTGNRNPAQMSTVVGVVLHIQQGTEAGTEAWQRDPRSRVSSHFLLPRAGGIRQMVDTADIAWCQIAGNLHWLSVECEGRSGDPLSAAQLEAASRVLAWAHNAYAVRLAVCNDPRAASPAAGGLGYHAMGGRAWGNHLDCPGRPVIEQRGQIVVRAIQLGGSTMQLDLGQEIPSADTPDVPHRTLGEWFGDVFTAAHVLPHMIRAVGAQLDAALTELALIKAELAALGADAATAAAPAPAWPPGTTPPAPPASTTPLTPPAEDAAELVPVDDPDREF